MARENIDVTVDLHDALSAPAARAEAAVGSLGREVGEASRALGGFDASASLTKRALDTLRRAAGATARAIDDVTDELKQASAMAVVARVAMAGLGKQAISAGRGLGVLKLALAGLGIAAVSGLLFVLIGALGALGAAAYAAVAGLSPLVATLGALPALLTGLIGTIATVRLGFRGIGDAMKVLGDPESTVEEIRAALAGLTPAGREFVTVLDEVRNQTSQWSKAIQAAMLPGFTAALRAIGPILPVIGNGLALMGGAVGRLASDLGDLVGGWGRDFRLIFEQNTRLIDNGLSPALQAFLSIFKNLVIVGGPLAERFATWVAESLQNIAGMVREGRRTGSLLAFFDRAGDLARAVKNVLVDLSVALFNIGRESGVLGDAMGRSFRRTIRDFRAWTESVEGKNSIRKFFEDAIPAVRELGRFTIALGKVFGAVGTNPGLAKMLRQIRKELMPALGELGTRFSTQIGPAFIDMLTGMATALAQIPTEPLTSFARAVGDLAVAFGDLLRENPALATFVATLLTASFAMKGVALAGRLSGATGLITSMVSNTGKIRVFTQALNGNTTALKANRTANTGAAKIGTALSGAWDTLRLKAMFAGDAIRKSTALMKVQAVVSKVLAFGLRALGAAWLFATGPIGIAIAVGLALVALFVLLYKKNETFRNAVNRVAAAVKDFAILAWEWIKRVGVAIGKWLVGAWKAIWPVIQRVASVVADVFGVVWKVVSTYGKMLWRFWSTVFAIIVGTVILFVTKVFIPYVKMLWRFWSTIVRAILQVWRTVFNAVAGVVMWLVRNVVIPYVKMLYRFWSTIVRAILAVWRVVFRAIMAVARTVFRGIQAAVGVMRRVLSVVFRAIGAVGRAIWRPIRTVASAVFRGIQAVAKVFGRVVGTVWDGIRSAAKRVFGALMGIARPVFRALRSAFEGFGDFVGGIWDGIRTAFSAALDGIKSALNSVIGVVNEAIRAFNKLPGGDIDPIPTLFTGGATKAGMTALVGEHGPEVHVTRSGAASIIGANGPELRRFTTPGYVVPNPVTPKTMIQPIPGWARAGADRFMGGAARATLAAAAVPPSPSLHVLQAPAAAPVPSAAAVGAAGAPAAGGLFDVPQIHIHLEGDGSHLTEADIERAAARAYRRMQREAKERR